MAIKVRSGVAVDAVRAIRKDAADEMSDEFDGPRLVMFVRSPTTAEPDNRRRQCKIPTQRSEVRASSLTYVPDDQMGTSTMQAKVQL